MKYYLILFFVVFLSCHSDDDLETLQNTTPINTEIIQEPQVIEEPEIIEEPQVVEVEGEKSYLIVFAGQSNASSENEASVLPQEYQKPIDSVFIWNQISQQFETYQAGVNSYTLQYKKKIRTVYGSELFLALKLKKKSKRKIYIVKHAVGGTPLYQRPEYDFNVTSTNEGFDHIKEQISNASNYLKTNKIPYDVKAMIWIQGEADGSRFERADAYKLNLTNFVEGIKNHIKEDFRFIYTRVACKRTYLSLIRQRIDEYKNEHPEDIMLDIDDLPLTKPGTDGRLYDKSHYNWTEINTLGERISNYID